MELYLLVGTESSAFGVSRSVRPPARAVSYVATPDGHLSGVHNPKSHHRNLTYEYAVEADPFRGIDSQVFDTSSEVQRLHMKAFV